MNLSKIKKIHHPNYLLTVLVVIILGFTVFNFKYFLLGKTQLATYFSHLEFVSEKSKFLFVKHPSLGFINNPGTYKLIFSNDLTEKKHTTSVTINELGYRFDASDINKYKNHIWLFGCSFNWGWSVSDNQTISYFMQKELKTHKIHNYAIPGYGNIQALIQLKSLLQSGQKPSIALFMYSSFHNIRNVAAPSRLKQIQSLRDFSCPAAFLEENQLKIKMVPINIDLIDSKELSVQETEEITKRIFAEIYALCSASEIPAVLCIQEGSLDNPVVKHCKKLGFKIFYMGFDLNSKNLNNLPFDEHPSAYAQKQYSDITIKMLQEHNLI